MKDNKTVNYQKITEETILELEKEDRRPRLLLHACCAPCASYPLVWLSETFDIVAFYDNPNIESQAEYDKRAQELLRFVQDYPFTYRPQVIIAPYQPQAYQRAVCKLTEEKEGGRRCRVCFSLRLDRAAKEASRQGADYLTTSLSISPHKDAGLLNHLASRAAGRQGLKALASDFKKKDGFKISTQLSKDHDLYRQDYCGCLYSKKESQERRGR